MKSLGLVDFMFLKDIIYAHKNCIYVKNTVLIFIFYHVI